LKSFRREAISPIDGWNAFKSVFSSTSEQVQIAPSLR